MNNETRGVLLARIGAKLKLNTFGPPTLRWYCPEPNGPGPGPFHGWYMEGMYIHEAFNRAGENWDFKQFNSPREGDELILHMAKLLKVNTEAG